MANRFEGDLLDDGMNWDKGIPQHVDDAIAAQLLANLSPTVRRDVLAHATPEQRRRVADAETRDQARGAKRTNRWKRR